MNLGEVLEDLQVPRRAYLEQQEHIPNPSLATNKDATYPVRLKGTTTEVTLKKTQKLTSAISIKDNTNVNLVYNEDGSINYNAVRQNIFNTVVESTTPGADGQ